MSSPRKSFLSKLDDAARWTGIPARVAGDLRATSSDDRKQQSLRWVPIWLIAVSGLLFVFSFVWPSGLLITFSTIVSAMAPAIHARGPLGKPSLEDDEREAALRKDSYLVCFAVLAAFNCIGQLVIMGLYVLQKWDVAQFVFVGASGFLLNLTAFWCLPTLYASWRLRGRWGSEGGAVD